METLQRKSSKTKELSEIVQAFLMQVFPFNAQSGLYSSNLQVIFAGCRCWAIWGQLSCVSRTRQASGVRLSGNFKGFGGLNFGHFMQIWGHFQAFSARIKAICREFMHLRDNMFRQRKIKETVKHSLWVLESAVNLQAFFRQQFTFWVVMGQFLVHLVSVPSKQKRRDEGGVVQCN